MQPSGSTLWFVCTIRHIWHCWTLVYHSNLTVSDTSYPGPQPLQSLSSLAFKRIHMWDICLPRSEISLSSESCSPVYSAIGGRESSYYVWEILHHSHTTFLIIHLLMDIWTDSISLLFERQRINRGVHLLCCYRRPLCRYLRSNWLGDSLSLQSSGTNVMFLGGTFYPWELRTPKQLSSESGLYHEKHKVSCGL